mmetsp:Transcript_26736/g.51865  ORF Transcript_26736/g.51865 Transcript_26736/m.51865 type:complete len:204 (+) Transcript_26736:194-805(+)
MVPSLLPSRSPRSLVAISIRCCSNCTLRLESSSPRGWPCRSCSTIPSSPMQRETRRPSPSPLSVSSRERCSSSPSPSPLPPYPSSAWRWPKVCGEGRRSSWPSYGEWLCSVTRLRRQGWQWRPSSSCSLGSLGSRFARASRSTSSGLRRTIPRLKEMTVRRPSRKGSARRKGRLSPTTSADLSKAMNTDQWSMCAASTVLAWR